MKPLLRSLLHSRCDLWQGNQHPAGLRTLASGFHELDRALPGSGWPLGTLTELMPQNKGMGEFSLLLPALARATQNNRWAALISPPCTAYAPALINAGIRLERLLVAEAGRETLWAAEQLLRSSLFSMVIFWADKTTHRQQRRLQLAAEAGDCWAVSYRPPSEAGGHSAAALRIILQQQENDMRLDIIKSRRSGKPRSVVIDHQHFLRVRQQDSNHPDGIG